MPLDFPSDPVDGQVYANFYYSASTGAWNSLGSSNLPSLLRNVTLSTSSASAVPVTVQGYASQSSNLQEWKNSSGTILSSVSASGVPTFPGGTFTSPASVQNAGITNLVLGGSDANGTIEIGRVDGVASTPYIDFHSSTSAANYNARISADGGTASSGSGNLTVTAAQLNLPTNTYAPGSTVQTIYTIDTNITTISTGSNDTFWSYSGLNTTITPKFSNSKFLVRFQINASVAEGSIRAAMNINGTTYGTTTTGVQRASSNSVWHAGSLPGTANIYGLTGEYLFQNTGASNVVVAFEIFKQNGGVVLYINRSYGYDDTSRGRPASWVTIQEIAT